jgi:hypothetical protein
MAAQNDNQYGGLYVLAYHFEPVPREVSQPVLDVKIRKQ